MKMYQVTLEGPGIQEVETFEATDDKSADEIAKEIFFGLFNYGVSEVKDPD